MYVYGVLLLPPEHDFNCLRLPTCQLRRIRSFNFLQLAVKEDKCCPFLLASYPHHTTEPTVDVKYHFQSTSRRVSPSLVALLLQKTAEAPKYLAN